MEFNFRRTYRGELKAAIFDWAGTTVDYGCIAPAGVFVDVFKDKGIEITMAEARGPMGLHKKDHIREVAKLEAVSERWLSVYGKPWNENDIEEMFSNFIPKQLGIIAKHSDLIPEILPAQKDLRARGMKIGSTTGYNNEMMAIVTEEAKKQGYTPDCVVCATDVPAGRPAPWMAYKNAMEFGIYPMEAIVKIGDTISDIEEGLNAGMWSVGVVKSSNEVGLTQEEIANTSDEVLASKMLVASNRFTKAGAHFVIDSLDELPLILDEINYCLSQGLKP